MQRLQLLGVEQSLAIFVLYFLGQGLPVNTVTAVTAVTMATGNQTAETADVHDVKQSSSVRSLVGPSVRWAKCALTERDVLFFSKL